MNNKKFAIYSVIIVILLISSAFLASKYWPEKTDRFYCAVDSDCKNTCKYGAVNKTWTENDMCLDGCASNAIGNPKCIENSCVAYDYKGEVVPYCTRLEITDTP